MKPVVETRNVHKYFGGVKALQGCDLKAVKGQITALIGPNGSGKTTLFNVISKLHEPDKGTILIEGQDIDGTKDYEAARNWLSRTFQQVKLFPNLSVRDHLALARSTHDQNLWYGLIRRKRYSDKNARKHLDNVGFNKPLNTFASDLSYGQRKLLDLAVALASPHELLMLDEPVAGVNPKLREQIKTLLKDLRKKGETILLIEHDMNFVMDLADEVYVLDEGKIITHGKPKDVQDDKRVLEAYLGE